MQPVVIVNWGWQDINVLVTQSTTHFITFIMRRITMCRSFQPGCFRLKSLRCIFEDYHHFVPRGKSSII